MSYDTLKNYHAIRVRYLGATNTLGARVKLVSGRFDRDAVTVERDYESRDSLHDAYKWLSDHLYTVVGQAELDDNGNVLFVEEFMPLREALVLRKKVYQASSNLDAIRRELGRKLLPAGFGS